MVGPVHGQRSPISSLFHAPKRSPGVSAIACSEQFVCWLCVHERLFKNCPPATLDLTGWRAWLHTALDSRDGPTLLETLTSKLIQVLLQG